MIKRRDVLVGGASLLGLTALQGCGSSTSSSIPGSTSVNPPLPPLPRFVQLPEISAAGTVLDTTLNVFFSTQTRTIAGVARTFQTRTYNGLIGGPTLRLRPGDKMRVNVVNQLPPNPDENAPMVDHNVPNRFNTTNLHTHGLHVSPQGNSDNIFVEIKPGDSFQYEYQLPPDHPAGTYWYHPHRHGSTLQQVIGGMAGALIIDGDFAQVPEIANARDLVFLVNELNIDATGNVPPFTAGGPYPISQRVLTVNGEVLPTLTMYSGEVVRLRVLNATARTQMPFQIENHELSLIALDAIALPAVRTTQVLNLAAGGRGDVMVQAGAPGTYTIFRRRDPDSANNNDPDVPLATLVVLPATLKMSLPTGVLPTHASLPDISEQELTAPERVLTFAVSGTGGPPGGFGNFTVNGVRFDPTVVNVTVPLGAVEQWRLVNTSNVSHPFHIHVNDFQVIAINDQPLPVPEWHDTISIPPARNGVPGSVTFRTRFVDFKGMYVFHCHILVHEDLGMMQIVNVV